LIQDGQTATSGLGLLLNKLLKKPKKLCTFRFGPLIAQWAANVIRCHNNRIEKPLISFQSRKTGFVHLLDGGFDSIKDLAEQVQAMAEVEKVQPNEIIASEGHCEDFDREFRPRNRQNQERWMRLAIAFTRGIALLAVDLIKIGDKYIVRDGHHRISVMKALGGACIDANVTEWKF
jgi:hypothetical protein